MSYGLREKHLTRLGNSFALIIDRPMLHSLGIGPKSQLRVHSDGHRIIIEAARVAHDLVMDRLEHVRAVYETSATATIEDAVASAVAALPG